MTLYIKNMVCDRCIMAVKDIVIKHGYTIKSIQLGEVKITETPNADELKTIESALVQLGFELMDDKKSQTIEKIKSTIIEMIQSDMTLSGQNLSDVLSRKLHHNYNYLSNLFTEVEGTTIEKYYIAQKIEKVKELLVYDELSLSEIAAKLNYSSVAYLSNQFKKITGLSPSHFKQIMEQKRKPLDKV